MSFWIHIQKTGDRPLLTELKRKGLDVIMRQYFGGSFEYPANAIKGIVAIKVEIENITGKQSG